MAPKYPPVDKPDEWFVAFTNAKREKVAADSIRRRSFSTYVPAMTVSRVQGRRRVTVHSPLFPRYVFVGLARGQNLLGLRQTPGLEGMVRVAGRPVTVEATMLDGLRAAEAAGAYDFTDEREAVRAAAARAEAAKAFVPGMKVSIVGGPFRSLSGVVDSLVHSDRILVAIKMLGSSHTVPMQLSEIQLSK